MDHAPASAQREPRTSRLFASEMMLDDGRREPIFIRNLSSGGLGAKCAALVYPGQNVRILLTGVGMVEGKIAWANAPLFGVQFDQKVDPGQSRLAPPPPKRDEYTVPPQFRPVTDHRRPGFKIR